MPNRSTVLACLLRTLLPLLLLSTPTFGAVGARQTETPEPSLGELPQLDDGGGAVDDGLDLKFDQGTGHLGFDDLRLKLALETPKPKFIEPATLSIAKNQSPFRVFRSYLAKPTNENAEISPLILNKSLLPDFQEPNSQSPNQISEVQQAIGWTSDTGSEDNVFQFGLTNHQYTIAQAHDLDLEWLAAEEPKEKIDEFKRRLAISFMYRARLLYGLGAFDLAKADYENSLHWRAGGTEHPTKQWMELNSQAQTPNATDLAKTDTELVKNAVLLGKAAESGEPEAIRKAFDLLIRAATLQPENADVLRAICKLCKEKNFFPAYIDPNAASMKFDQHLARTAKINALESAQNRIFIESATRLAMLDEREGLRLRAPLLSAIGLSDVAKSDTQKLVSYPDASSRDWLEHGRATHLATGLHLNEYSEKYLTALNAYTKSLKLDRNQAEALWLRANLHASYLVDHRYADHHDMSLADHWEAFNNDLRRLKQIVSNDSDASTWPSIDYVLQSQAETISAIARSEDGDSTLFNRSKKFAGLPKDKTERFNLAIELLNQSLASFPANTLRHRELTSKIEGLKRELKQSSELEPDLPLPLPSETK